MPKIVCSWVCKNLGMRSVSAFVRAEISLRSFRLLRTKRNLRPKKNSEIPITSLYELDGTLGSGY
jgi:hypothetical protein